MTEDRRVASGDVNEDKEPGNSGGFATTGLGGPYPGAWEGTCHTALSSFTSREGSRSEVPALLEFGAASPKGRCGYIDTSYPPLAV